MLRWNLYIFVIFKHVSLCHCSGWMSTDGCCHTQTAKGRVICIWKLYFPWKTKSSIGPATPSSTSMFSQLPSRALRNLPQRTCAPLIRPRLNKGLSTSATGQKSSMLRNTSQKSMTSLPLILFVFQHHGTVLSKTLPTFTLLQTKPFYLWQSLPV